MKIITRKLPKDHNLFLFGDDHEGSLLRHDDGWAQLCDMMHSEYDGCSHNYGIHHGDPIEAIMVDDYRYDIATCKNPIPLEQVEVAKKNIAPIKSKIIAMCEGNHPLKLWRFGNLTRAICEPLGIEYGTWSFKLRALDSKGNLMYKGFHIHGKKSITSTAEPAKRKKINKELILARILREKAGDCILMSRGHSHLVIVSDPNEALYMTDDSKKLRQAYNTIENMPQNVEYIHPDFRWYVGTGSFLKTQGEDVSGYAEIAEYDPVELGFAVARVRDRRIVGVDKVYL